MKKTGIGIIGCGYWGKNYVRVFHELPQTRVVQVCDLQADRLEMVAAYYASMQTTTSCEEVLENPAVDAVVVATPASDHYRTVRACLLAGKPVLVEKPLALTVAEAEHLVSLSRQQERLLMIGHTFLYNAGIRKMREYIHDDSFGRVYYLHATRTNLGPIRKDVNATWDLATHDVSIFNYLLDAVPFEVNAVGAHFLSNGKEDVGFVTLRYPNGIMGNIHVSWVDPNKVRQVVVVGSQRRIVFDDLKTLDRIRIFDKGVAAETDGTESFGEFRLLVHDGDIISPKIEASEPLKNQCTHFLKCLQSGTQPLSDGNNGLDVVRVMVAIEESMQQNGAAVPVARLMPDGRITKVSTLTRATAYLR